MTITVQASLDGGAYASGGITATLGQTLDLKLASTAGLDWVRWTLTDYPPGFALPAGWTDAGDGTHYHIGFVPPQVPGLTPWGKWMIRALGSNGDVDEATAISVESPGGLRDFAYGEDTQFGGADGWAGDQKANLRTVDAAVVSGAGSWKSPVTFASTSPLPAYAYSAGVITADANGAFPTTDGVTPEVGDTFLHAGEAPEGFNGPDHGIYTITAIGDGSNPFAATRRADFDATADLIRGARIPVLEGTRYGGSVFTFTTPDAVLDTDTLSFQASVITDTLDVRDAITTDNGDTSQPVKVSVDLNSGASPVTFATINTAADGDDVIYEVTVFCNLRQDGGGAGDYIQKFARAFERDGGTLAARTALRNLENAADDTDGTGLDIAVSTDDIVISIDPDSTNSYNGALYYSVAKHVVV